MQKLMIAVLTTVSIGISVQALGQQGAYEGVSNPPADVINATPEDQPVIAKPSAAVVARPAAQYQSSPTSTSQGPTSQDPSGSFPAADQVPSQQTLSRRAAVDPDGDIVQPRAARPGELMEGATMRVKLLDRLSSSESEKGEQFRGQVQVDVLQDGKVMIPAGSSIEGRVASASSGHFAGHGSLRLKPEAVILPDGTRYQLRAETTGTIGSKARMGSEGTIRAGSRAKKDGVEYGAVVGAGAISGAVIAGPVGALTGGLIGAGMVTTHLMVDHPQATLEPGTVLLFTTTESMNLTPAMN